MAEQPIQPGRRVLLVDDDSALLRNYRWCLEDAGFHVVSAQNGEQARQRLAQNVFDMCFLDLMIGEESGLDLLPLLRADAPWMRIVMSTAEDSLQTAVTAMQKGAVDYLTKPCPPDRLLLCAERQSEARRLELRIEQLKDGGDAPAPEFSSAHPAMARLLETARQAAASDATILILGESGTGKNVVARAIHQWSERHGSNFATVNCPSLSAELLESELFGHTRGAFTGASDNRQGRVQIADRGTLFLDEIGDFPLSLQPKLLRFVQDREYERVGDPVTRKADVRIIAATNRNLAEMVKAGTFREDLWYRLNVIALELPPLRERRDDIAGFAESFLAQFVAAYRRPARRIDDEAMAQLVAQDWPGNLRELRNVIERVSILCPEEVVRPQHLPVTGKAVVSESGGALRVGHPVSLEALERAHIEAIVASATTLDAAAKTLGVDASTLYRKRKQYGL